MFTLAFGRQQQQSMMGKGGSTSRMDGYNDRLPEQYSPSLSQISNSVEPALLFDFKATVCSLDGMVRALLKTFGVKAIVAIKRQPSSSNDRIRVEVLFGSTKDRRRALERGLVVKGTRLHAKPMVSPDRGYLVLQVSNLPVESPEAAEPRLYHVLENSSLPNTIILEYLQLHTIQHIYNSTATVVLSVPCSSNLNNLAEETHILFRDSPELPTLNHVSLCYAFCSRCKALDDHQASDCESIAIARGQRVCMLSPI